MSLSLSIAPYCGRPGRGFDGRFAVDSGQFRTIPDNSGHSPALSDRCAIGWAGTEFVFSRDARELVIFAKPAVPQCATGEGGGLPVRQDCGGEP